MFLSDVFAAVAVMSMMLCTHWIAYRQRFRLSRVDEVTLPAIGKRLRENEMQWEISAGECLEHGCSPKLK